MATDPPDSGTSLRWTLLLYVVVPLILVMAFVGYQSLRTLEHWIERRMQTQIALITRTLQFPLSRAAERVDRDALDDALESAFRLHQVFGIYLYDLEGRVFAAAGVEESLSLAKQSLGLVTQGRQWGEYGHVADQAVYSYFVPLTDTAGQPFGVLRVTRLASDFTEYIAGLRLRALIVLLAEALILATLVWIGHYFAIGKPLGRLVTSMSKITEGDRTHRTPIQGPREIAALSLALNHMLDSIDRAEREIERRHEVQTELERRLQRAETMASLGRLAAGVAHELGTPLGVVAGKAQRLLRRKECPPAMKDSLHEIRHEVWRMEQIVRQLLDFGRNQGGHRRIMKADQLAEMASNAVRTLFDETRTTLETAGSKPIPSVSVNPMRLEQSLVNLLKNACQASPGGRVRLSWFSDGPWVGFRIEDDGPGIPQEIKPRIIEPFFTTKDVGQGSGLGLAIVDSVAQEHGGSVEIEDSLLGGAAFVLRLPRTEGSDAQPNDNA